MAKLLRDVSIARVVVFDNFTSGKIEHLKDSVDDPRLEIVRADIKDKASITSAMSGSDTVFHLAANPDIAKAVTTPDIDFWEGTYLVQNMLEAMRVNDVRRLLYMSGSGIYGDNAGVNFSESYGPNLPISTYGASKLACEALICAYCHMFNITARAFRFANVVGPRQTHGVGYDFIRRLKSDPSQLRILGDGRQSKSYIHVDDVIRAIFLANEKCMLRYDVYNVASADYITVAAIAELAIQVSMLRNDAVEIKYTGGDRGWKGDVPIVRFDCSKIRSLGWNCAMTSSEAIEASLKAMLTQIT